MGIKVISRRKVLAVKLNAGSTPGGAPRRGWVLLYPTGAEVGFWDDDYGGTGELKDAFPNVVQTIAWFNVPVSEYRRWMKREIKRQRTAPPKRKKRKANPKRKTTAKRKTTTKRKTTKRKTTAKRTRKR